MRVLFLGFGYVADATARQLAGSASLAATTRDSSKAKALEAHGITPVRLGNGAGALEQAIGDCTHILVSAPPGEAGDPFAPLIGANTLENRWCGYLSTTGVYGDRQGGWAFEWDTPAPSQPRSVRRLEAETGWQARGARIFRLSGIYGPQSSALDALREGRARRIVKPGHVFSRIHVEDIASALVLAMKRPEAAGIFNLTDDLPSSQSAVVEEAARLLNIAPPPEEAFDPETMSAMLAGFYGECRRVSNARAKQVLGWRPRYPSFREGLAAISAGEKASTAPAP
ncbi:MAG: SDR family NAD(P)-dependent oxidoreductase [Caulobacterales bacterium]|uniref:SDR family NAD(P)-dependent oxidoreductase n=1 Tax=Glycocaulis sp. TaxID=1969725 RepID=UPI003F9FBBCB